MSEACEPPRERQGPRDLRARRRAPAASSRATGSRPSTSCCRPRSPTRGGCSPGSPASGSRRPRSIVPNHLLALGADGRSTDCRRLEMLPIECVVRGYLAGSGWKDYRASGEVCGHRLPAGLRRVGAAARADLHAGDEGARRGHDENIDRAAAVALVGEERFDEVERLTLELYRFASERAAERGIILADTKLEFGVDADGPARPRRRGLHARLVAVLAAPTSTSPAAPQPSFDKQFVRDYCESLGWDKTPPGPRAARPRSSRARAPATSRRSSA